MSLIGIPVIDNIAINFKCIYLYSRVLESAYGARKIASESGARKKNSERELRSERSGSAGNERRSSNLRK